MSSSGPEPTKANSDYIGQALAMLTAILAIVVVGAHAYLASSGKADTVTTLLLNVLALTFSTICTIWVGRWSAQRENKAFIRAALRTTYGLHEGLRVAEQSAIDGISRMKTRESVSIPVLSDLWEEVFGRVLDQVRSQMRRAQETVANWQEFLPEEVQKLTEAEDQKASTLNEMTVAVEQARAILSEMGEYAQTADTAALRARIEALEQERAKLSASSAFAIPATGEARKLLAVGALEESIAAYSSLIATSPTSYSLYVQRARAKYLAGDTAGALEDLKCAEEKCPTDPSIERLREEIRAGRRLVPISITPVQAVWSQLAERGHNALAAGNAEEALKQYRAAREAGLIHVLAAQDEAMALLALGQVDDARKTIEEVMPATTGPFVRVQAFLLLALAHALEGTNAGDAINRLRDCLEDLRFIGTPFQISQSPLQYLVQALRSKGDLTDSVRAVLRIVVPASGGSQGDDSTKTAEQTVQPDEQPNEPLPRPEIPS